jgi:hypothetical protein
MGGWGDGKHRSYSQMGLVPHAARVEVMLAIASGN